MLQKDSYLLKKLIIISDIFYRYYDGLTYTIYKPQKLALCGMSNSPLIKFPTNTTTLLDFSKLEFSHPLPELPDSLLYLKLGPKFNATLPTLPPTLQSITFGAAFKQEVFFLHLFLSHSIRFFLKLKNSVKQSQIKKSKDKDNKIKNGNK